MVVWAAGVRYARRVNSGALKHAQLPDLLALDPDARVELVGGQLVPKAEANARHGKAQGTIRRFIGGPFDDDDGYGGPGGWWIFTEVLVLLGPDVFRPDLSGWLRERLPDPAQHTPIEVVPDWCCEVLSPSNARHDRVTKRAAYARAGVRHYWLVDPETRMLEALELDADGRWRECGVYDETTTDARIPPFEAIALDVGRLFFPPSPAP